jgi:hypothetical protein
LPAKKEFSATGDPLRCIFAEFATLCLKAERAAMQSLAENVVWRLSMSKPDLG